MVAGIQGSSRNLQQQLSQQQATQQQMASQQATQQQLPQQALADQQLPQKALGAVGNTQQQGAGQGVQRQLPQQAQQQLTQQAAGAGQAALQSDLSSETQTQGSQNQGSQNRKMGAGDQGGAAAQLDMDKCFRDFNPATREGYQDVVATWLAALLTLAEHLAANPRASLLKNDADQHQLPLPPVPPFKQDLAA